MKPSISLAASALVGLAVASSCGRNHDALALRDEPRGGAAGSGASGGTAGSAGGGGRGGSSRGGASTGGVSNGGSGGKFVEPKGRNSTTFLHGIVDAERLLVCFARRSEQGEPVLVGDPIPSGGLEYATSLAFEELDDIDFAEHAVLPYVIAGELELVDELDCEAAVERAREEMELAGMAALGAGGAGGVPGAGGEGGSGDPVPPRLRVRSLAEAPRGAFAEGYSSLYVAVGCLGGLTFTGEHEREACGSRYRPGAPTASGMLVTLSRVRAFDKIGLQTMNATSGTSPLVLISAPPDTAVQPSFPIAYDLGRGQIAPRAAEPRYTATEYGLTVRGWKVEITSGGTRIASELWSDVTERAGLQFENGRTFTVIALGPSADVGEATWNPSTVGVVDNDPEP